MMFCLAPQNTPHIIKLIAYLVLRYYWVILPLSLDMQGVMAIYIGLLKFFTFCARGGLQRISPNSICTHSLPYPTPLQIYKQYQEPHPIGPAALPAGCYSEPGQGRQATYHIHASTHKYTSTHASVSV